MPFSSKQPLPYFTVGAPMTSLNYATYSQSRDLQSEPRLTVRAATVRERF